MILESFPVGLLHCNCTILGDEVTHEAIVVDPGDNLAEILSRLQKHGLTLRQIVVTHAHIDHVGGAALLKRATGAPVLLNQRDLGLLGAMEMQAGWLGVPTPEVEPPDASAEDGLTVGLGALPAEVIHTPGHTPGSICLLFPAQHLLIAGDTLFAGLDRKNRSPRRRWAANPALPTRPPLGITRYDQGTARARCRNDHWAGKTIKSISSTGIPHVTH